MAPLEIVIENEDSSHLQTAWILPGQIADDADLEQTLQKELQKLEIISPFCVDGQQDPKGMHHATNKHWTRLKALLALTVKDFEAANLQDAEENHERSQDLFAELLQQRNLPVSRARFLRRKGQNTFQPIGLHLTMSAQSRALYFKEDSNDEDHMDRVRTDFAVWLFKKMQEASGIYVIRFFRTTLQSMDKLQKGLVGAYALEGVLSQMGLRLTEEEICIVKSHFPGSSKDEVNYVQLLSFGYRNWSKRREEVVHECYELLRQHSPGGILHLKTVLRNFNLRVLSQKFLPHVDLSEPAVIASAYWNECSDLDGLVSYKEFCFHYLDLSPCFASETEFTSFVCKSWGLDPDEWLAKRVFQKFTSPGQPTILKEDFKQMMLVLCPKLHEDEAFAWYKVLDEEQKGYVTIESFLHSGLLKARRIFDDFVTRKDGGATKEEMILILQSLCPNMSTEEAENLYNYVDLDGNGQVSFAEFLENRLLQLVKVYTETTEGKTSQVLTEDTMQHILRKLDPRLNRESCKAIYKAVDTDSNGTVSIVEFCQSNVLRCKAMFDRFDLNRTGVLNELKFFEMLTFFDNSLREDEKQAIYNLVVDHQASRITLASFLNPNVIKLKQLFEKYRRRPDAERVLEKSCFKAMLKELWVCGHPQIEDLVDTSFPHSSSISFVEYLQRYKELQLKFDSLRLTKKPSCRRAHRRI